MVLVDTSVWIRFLAGKAPYAGGLDALLADDEVLAHDFVHGELLIGDRGGRGRLLASYAKMFKATHVSHAEVVAFVRARRLHGTGIGWIDAHLLASVVIDDARLWTADAALGQAARSLGVAHLSKSA